MMKGSDESGPTKLGGMSSVYSRKPLSKPVQSHRFAAEQSHVTCIAVQCKGKVRLDSAFAFLSSQNSHKKILQQLSQNQRESRTGMLKRTNEQTKKQGDHRVKEKGNGFLRRGSPSSKENKQRSERATN